MKELVVDVDVDGDGAKNHPYSDEVIIAKLYRKPNKIFIIRLW